MRHRRGCFGEAGVAMGLLHGCCAAAWPAVATQHPRGRHERYGFGSALPVSIWEQASAVVERVKAVVGAAALRAVV